MITLCGNISCRILAKTTKVKVLRPRSSELGILNDSLLDEGAECDAHSLVAAIPKTHSPMDGGHDGIGDVPSPIHSYLSTNYKELRNMDKDNPALVAKAKGRWYVPDPNKQADLEKLREKGLLKEFNGYLQIRGKLKEFRLEAVRAGFKKAWSDKDYKLILDFASRIPSNIIEEDPKLLMWYNGALTRLEK